MEFHVHVFPPIGENWTLLHTLERVLRDAAPSMLHSSTLRTISAILYCPRWQFKLFGLHRLIRRIKEIELRLCARVGVIPRSRNS
jgi:hypothetical protein